MRLENKRETVGAYLKCLNLHPRGWQPQHLRIATDLGTLALPVGDHKYQFLGVGIAGPRRVPHPGYAQLPTRPNAPANGGLLLANTVAAFGWTSNKLTAYLTPVIDESQIDIWLRNARMHSDGRINPSHVNGLDLIRIPVDKPWLNNNRISHTNETPASWLVYLGHGVLEETGVIHAH